MTREQAHEQIIQNKNWRKRLREILEEMRQATKDRNKSTRDRSLSITHLEDSIMRLGCDMEFVDTNCEVCNTPYPESFNPANAIVSPQAP